MIKKLIKYVFPYGCWVLYQRLLKKQAIQYSTLLRVKRHTDKSIVIGNGPSLNVSIKKYQDIICSTDSIVVNEFALTDYYTIIKPNYYALADPAYFDSSSRYKETTKALFKALNEKTEWPLLLIIPNNIDVNILNDYFYNTNISITQYLNIGQTVKKRNKYELWDDNMTAPPCQTVLNLSVYLSLFWGYQETYIIGADSSFLEDLFVDQSTNDLYTKNTHFYDNQNVIKDKEVVASDKGTKWESDWSLSRLLSAFANMFKGYEELAEYADYKGLKVYNASEYSWINCFERKKLK